ncbi:hypothetical protein QVD17_28518 [Tagetes erecta]|uniref:Uncharacterized protein n=1 Tax=Tagetes erecta TaxID=13708 RepID=A0AAD8KF68_TARER|nr:hypothetical protein QVD17_28518 [Tagetes erecta]
MVSQLINLNNNHNNKNTIFLGYADSFSSRESDIEMISIDSFSSYTSLKDVLRATSPPSSPVESLKKFRRIDSWREIPIKDPLLQHAAWAYLQPMNSEPETGERCGFRKLKECLCGFFVRS